ILNIRKTRWLALWIIVLFPFGLKAQERATIQAIVIDELSQEPVGFASAALLEERTQNYVKGMQTVDNGKILSTDVAPGTYVMRITYVGYEDYLKTEIQVNAGEQVDLGNIPLQPSGELLDEVVIDGTPPAMELGIDRRIFNVEQSTISMGGTATDVL